MNSGICHNSAYANINTNGMMYQDTTFANERQIVIIDANSVLIYDQDRLLIESSNYPVFQSSINLFPIDNFN